MTKEREELIRRHLADRSKLHKTLVRSLGAHDASDDVEILLAELDRIRAVVEDHRQKSVGHDQCWENDVELYHQILGVGPEDPQTPPLPEFMNRCAAYWLGRCGSVTKE